MTRETDPIRPTDPVDALDQALAELSAAAPPPSEALMARVRMDARILQAQAHSSRPRSLLQALRESVLPFGGWGGATALAASALLGLLVGYTGVEEASVWLAPGTDDVVDPLAAFLFEG
ncbi:MAG: hypothetical protein AAGI50_01290 [Pseudomonadota bacterium]